MFPRATTTRKPTFFLVQGLFATVWQFQGPRIQVALKRGLRHARRASEHLEQTWSGTRYHKETLSSGILVNDPNKMLTGVSHVQTCPSFLFPTRCVQASKGVHIRTFIHSTIFETVCQYYVGAYTTLIKLSTTNPPNRQQHPCLSHLSFLYQRNYYCQFSLTYPFLLISLSHSHVAHSAPPRGFLVLILPVIVLVFLR